MAPELQQQAWGAPAPAAPGAPAPAAVAPAANAPKEPEQLGPDAPRVLAGFLVSYDEKQLGVYWPIYQGSNVIGRIGAADGLDIEIDHPTTSSRHAVIYAAARPGRVKLEDVGSTNGTFFRENKLAPGTKTELNDGDEVRFGGFNVIVKIVR
jgi:pSer/pThr/pTyr-binding forkhead associated (FHA) protein